MNFMRKYLLMVIILGSLMKVFGQDKNEILKFSISEAQTYALQNNRAIRAGRIDVSSMDKQIWANIATGLPQINFDANYQHQFVIPTLNLGPYLDVNSLSDGVVTKSDLVNAYKNSPSFALGVRNNTILNFTLSQLIFSGEYLVGLQAAKVVKQVLRNHLSRQKTRLRKLWRPRIILYWFLKKMPEY